MTGQTHKPCSYQPSAISRQPRNPHSALRTPHSALGTFVYSWPYSWTADGRAISFQLSAVSHATAVACYLDGDLPTGLLDWRGWIAPDKMWNRLRANGLSVEWKRE